MRKSSVQRSIGKKHSTGYIVKNSVVCKSIFIQAKSLLLKSGTGGRMMIQIDMEMPFCCYDCDFSIGVMSTKADRECTITDKYVNDDDKPEWCPLMEVEG